MQQSEKDCKGAEKLKKKKKENESDKQQTQTRPLNSCLRFVAASLFFPFLLVFNISWHAGIHIDVEIMAIYLNLSKVLLIFWLQGNRMAY